ncbi:MAG: extracellular solute-binding protein [Elusimicrobia bacterium]|nr:extracellular solute-binding protein [Elusimicrobiota bacterium]
MKVLQLWVLPARGMRTYPLVKEQLRDFLREHPDTQVEVTVRTPGSLWSQLFARLKRPREAQRPHLVEIPSHWTATLAYLGLLEDLGELEPGLSLAPWHPPLHEHCRAGKDGSVFSLPWWMEAPVVYFRPDLLRKCGLEPDALSSWASLREACRQLAKRLPASVHPIANGNPRESVSLADVAPPVWSRGGDFFSRDGARAVFHREEAYHGVRAYLELIEKGWMPLSGKSGLVSPTLFEGGAALQFWGRIERPSGRAATPLGAAPTPRGERAQAGVLTAHHLAALRGAGLAREAFGLLKHLTRPAQGARYASALGTLPCATAELDAALVEADELGRVFRRALEQSRLLPNFAALGTLERIFDRSMENLLRAILRRSYDGELLRQEMIYAASEMDYILSMGAPGEKAPEPRSAAA